MTRAATVVLMAARIDVVLALLLGVAFWMGSLRALIPLHMLLGLVLTLLLWTAAALARRTASMGLVVAAALWGLFLVGFGMTQTKVLVGRLHWIVQALHLVVGVAAVALIEGLLRPRGEPTAPVAQRAASDA